MLYQGLKWDPASWAGSSLAHSIPQGLKRARSGSVALAERVEEIITAMKTRNTTKSHTGGVIDHGDPIIAKRHDLLNS